MGMAELSAALWRERHLLDLLRFKLEVEHLVLSSGRTRWLGHAVREVEQVLDGIRTAELGRAIEADAAALELGLEPGGGLLALVGAAPEPWDDLLASHREALIALTAQIEGVAHRNRHGVTSALRTTQEAILGLQRTVGVDVPSGTSSGSAVTPRLLGVGPRRDEVPPARADVLTLEVQLPAPLRLVAEPDPAASVVELQLHEITLQAALGATSRVLQPTLLDFLR